MNRKAGENMAFNYNKLKGRIVEICGTQSEFASRMDISERTISLKLKGKISWKQKEILKALEVLNLSISDIQEYFFNVCEVQNVEQ